MAFFDSASQSKSIMINMVKNKRELRFEMGTIPSPAPTYGQCGPGRV